MAGGFVHEMRNALSPALYAGRALYSNIDAGNEDSFLETYERSLNTLAEGLRHKDAAMTDVVSTLQEKCTWLKEALTAVETGLERGMLLTQTTLKYAEAGFLIPGADTVPVGTLVDGIVAEFDERMRGQTIALDVNVDRELSLVVNRDHVSAVLRNLVGNACDALRDSSTREKHIWVRAERSQEGIVLSVRDNGGGMDEIAKTKVFRPFFSTKGRQGTGLGLGLCRQIMQAYGGEIQFESPGPQQGTTFRVTFPQVR